MDWSSLFISGKKQKEVYQAIDTVHREHGYQPYNPFPGGTGTPREAKHFVKLLIQWKQNGWVQAFGEADPDLLPAIATVLETPIIYAWINKEQHHIELIGEGTLLQYLADGKTEDDFNKAKQFVPSEVPQNAAIDDIVKAYGVGGKGAQKLLDKTTNRMLGKLNHTTKEGESFQADAQQAIQQAFSWQQPSAQKLSAILRCLSIPAGWQSPTQQTLITAYQAACLLELDDNTPLLPSDDQALDIVDYPLDYKLAYYAKGV